MNKVGGRKAFTSSCQRGEILDLQNFTSPAGPGPIKAGLDHDTDVSLQISQPLLLHRVHNAPVPDLETDQLLPSLEDLNRSHIRTAVRK